MCDNVTKTEYTMIYDKDEHNKEQESPPAWTQEAYRPLCSKYSLCCPNWVPPWGGYPDPPRGGYPVRYPRGVPGPPQGGYPDPRGVPGQVPPSRGVPRPPGGVPSQVPPQGGYPDSPPPLWTDKHLWKQYLPVVLRTRAVIIGSNWH